MSRVQREFRCPELGTNNLINLLASCRVSNSEQSMEKERFYPIVKSFRRLLERYIKYFLNLKNCFCLLYVVHINTVLFHIWVTSDFSFSRTLCESLELSQKVRYSHHKEV